ncbi:MAG TPA: patatin family protein [Clostridia bacterium]|nr:patatin family protein [Clostridia bacterium]
MTDAGLILEGGGMRGLYTAGVLDYLLDAKLYFPWVYGVSAGACHGASYVSRQRGRAVRTVLDFLHDRHYASFHSLLTTGDFFGVDMIYRKIPDELLPFDYDAYAASDSRMIVVVFNCRTGACAYLPATDLRRHIDYIRASSSLPLLSRMVRISGEPYLDGGIGDSIPLEHAMREGRSSNLVVLTQHRGYRKSPEGAMLPLMRRKYAAYPQVAESMRTRHERYNAQLAFVYEQERLGKALVIQPGEPVTIGRMEKDAGKLRALYEQGYADAKAKEPEIRQLIG